VHQVEDRKPDNQGVLDAGAAPTKDSADLTRESGSDDGSSTDDRQGDGLKSLIRLQAL
jgi:hypothetical protein